MADRDSATLYEIKDKVHGNDLINDKSVNTNLTRTNKLLVS